MFVCSPILPKHYSCDTALSAQGWVSIGPKSTIMCGLNNWCLECLAIYTIYEIPPSQYALLARGRKSQWNAIKVPLGKLLTNNLPEQDDALMSPLSYPDTSLSTASSGHHIWDSFQGCGWALLSSQLARAEQDSRASYFRGQLWMKSRCPHICLHLSTEHFHRLHLMG